MIPVTENSTHINDDYKVNELIDKIASSPADFEHLKIFLSRERYSDFYQDYEFLMVTQSSFGKIILLDVNVEYPYVSLEIRDCCTQQSGNVRIDINDSNPKTLFICWQDIKKMVLDDIATSYSNDELLDFDF